MSQDLASSMEVTHELEQLISGNHGNGSSSSNPGSHDSSSSGYPEPRPDPRPVLERLAESLTLGQQYPRGAGEELEEGEYVPPALVPPAPPGGVGGGGPGGVGGKAPRGERLCQVCGDQAAGSYFGALVCIPCKAFFIRSTSESAGTFECPGERNCKITVNTRTSCKYCRFQKCITVGMCRKERPTSMSASDGHQLCVVCEDQANGVHFGAVTCEGCKKFFRRGLKESKSYVCKGNRDCIINPRTRNNCRYCRFAKCLKHGMSREAIQMGRPSKFKKTYCPIINGDTPNIARQISGGSSGNHNNHIASNHDNHTTGNLGNRSVGNHGNSHQMGAAPMWPHQPNPNGMAQNFTHAQNVHQHHAHAPMEMDGHVVPPPGGGFGNHSGNHGDLGERQQAAQAMASMFNGCHGNEDNAMSSILNVLMSGRGQQSPPSLPGNHGNVQIKQEVPEHYSPSSSPTELAQRLHNTLLTCLPPSETQKKLAALLKEGHIDVGKLIRNSASSPSPSRSPQQMAPPQGGQPDLPFSMMGPSEGAMALPPGGVPPDLGAMMAMMGGGGPPPPGMPPMPPFPIQAYADFTEKVVDRIVRKRAAPKESGGGRMQISLEPIKLSLKPPFTACKYIPLPENIPTWEFHHMVNADYWLKGALPDENIILSDEHQCLINQITSEYDSYKKRGQEINSIIRKDVLDFQEKNAIDSDTPDTVALSKGIITWFEAGTNFCLNLPGFHSIPGKDKATIIRSAANESRCLLAAIHWYNPLTQEFEADFYWNKPHEKRVDWFLYKKIIKFAQKIAKLNVDNIEAALMNALIFMSTDVPGLQDTMAVTEVRETILKTFTAYTTAKYASGNTRIRSLFENVPGLREIGICHNMVDQFIIVDASTNKNETLTSGCHPKSPCSTVSSVSDDAASFSTSSTMLD